MNLIDVVFVFAAALELTLLALAYMVGKHVANEKWIERHHGKDNRPVRPQAPPSQKG